MVRATTGNVKNLNVTAILHGLLLIAEFLLSLEVWVSIRFSVVRDFLADLAPFELDEPDNQRSKRYQEDDKDEDES